MYSARSSKSSPFHQRPDLSMVRWIGSRSGFWFRPSNADQARLDNQGTTGQCVEIVCDQERPQRRLYRVWLLIFETDHDDPRMLAGGIPTYVGEALVQGE